MKKIFAIISVILAIAYMICGFNVVVYADTVDELRDKISEKGFKIEDLEKEIDIYNREIVKVQAESQTLTHAISELDWTRKKLNTDIAVTGNQIESTGYTIEKIQVEINNATGKIQSGNLAIANLMRTMDELEAQSLIEVLLANEELSDFWNDLESLQNSRETISDNLVALEILKNELKAKKSEDEEEKQELEELESKFVDQKKVVEYNKKEKTTLLTKTKSKESEYQGLLAEKKAAKEAFEQELAEYESQLKIIIDQSRLPALGSGVLGWPLKDLSIKSCYDGSTDAGNCVTQYFGDTAFARTGAYNGKNHSGVDFRAAVGEQLYSSAAGTVIGVGDTDTVCRYASYGKWVLISHDNGLSTLYAHLSLIKVQSGQYVHKGDIIGYSGNTGHSTGSHLHYSVYASEGVSIGQLKSRACSGAIYTIPLAPFNAYLNPIDYLAQ